MHSEKSARQRRRLLLLAGCSSSLAFVAIEFASQLACIHPAHSARQKHIQNPKHISYSVIICLTVRTAGRLREACTQPIARTLAHSLSRAGEMTHRLCVSACMRTYFVCERVRAEDTHPCVRHAFNGWPGTGGVGGPPWFRTPGT